MDPFGFFWSKLFSAPILFFSFRLPIYKNPGKLKRIITSCFSKSLTTWLIKTSRKGSVNRNVHKCYHDKMHEWWMDIDVNKSGTAAVTGQAGMRSPLRFSEISYCLFWRDDGGFFFARGMISESRGGSSVYLYVCVHPPRCGWCGADQRAETTTECYLWSADSFRTTAYCLLQRYCTHTHTHRTKPTCTLNMHRQTHSWTGAERNREEVCFFI